MPSELDQIKDIFDNFGIPLSMEWLESCIEWCKNDNLPPNYTLKNLQNMVYAQWLILDLRDIEISSLPRNLSLEKRFSLTEVYYLQLMQVIDISKPKLWQLQRIRNKVGKNTELENDFGKRVLQLTLTDGVQEIQAMEFKPIGCLNINLTPGTKIKITGPVMVRNGRLMLEEGHMKNLGGSVDDLIVKYAAENVLARALGLEENANPHVIDENILEVFTQATQGNTTTRITQNHNASNQNLPRNNPTIQSLPKNNNTARNAAQNVSIPNRTPVNQEIPPEFQVDDELLRELEEDFEENSVSNFKKSLNVSGATQISKFSIPTNTSRSSTIPQTRDCTSPDLFEEMEIDDELLNEHLDQIASMDSNLIGLSNKTTATVHSIASSNKHVNNKDTGQSKKNFNNLQNVAISSSGKCKGDDNVVINLDDSFDDIDIDSHLDHLDEEMKNLPCSTQKVRDFKEKVKSPELKRPAISTPKLSLAKPLGSTRLMQSKLNFGKTDDNGTSKGGLNFDDDDDFETPINAHSKSYAHKRPAGFVPIDISCIAKESPRTPNPISLLPSWKSGSLSAAGGTAKESLAFPTTSTQLPSSVKGKDSSKTSPGQLKMNVLSIEKLKTLMPNVSKGKFKVKGKFQCVAEKLQITPTSFFLVIVVADESGDLTVQMDSDVVAGYAGIRPERLEELREKVSQNDQTAKLQIHQFLTNLNEKCSVLDNVLEIQVTRGQKYPVVINIVEEF